MVIFLGILVDVIGSQFICLFLLTTDITKVVDGLSTLPAYLPRFLASYLVRLATTRVYVQSLSLWALVSEGNAESVTLEL